LSVLFGEPKVAPIRPQTQFALAYLVLFGSIGMFLLYLFVLRRMSASGATYVMLVAPLAAVGFGAALLGEPVHSIFLVGSVFVLSGVYVGVISQAVRRE
jgi:drug/metabolite transporter (DMT)-like permease